MQILFRSKGLPNVNQVRDHTRRRLQFALGRFQDAVASVRVSVEDVNGPKGGVDKHCRLRVTLVEGGPPILAEGWDEEVPAAVDAAAQRLTRSVTRALSRRRTRPSRTLSHSGVDHVLP